jgi:hypothetical protein
MSPRAPEPCDVAPFRPELLREESSNSKLSTPLSSQSNEADDEQSLSDPSYDMESSTDAPHYEGEDTRVTSDKELAGFYMYGWAAEVLIFFSISRLPTFRVTTRPRARNVTEVWQASVRVQASNNTTTIRSLHSSRSL